MEWKEVLVAVLLFFLAAAITVFALSVWRDVETAKHKGPHRWVCEEPTEAITYDEVCYRERLDER